MYFVDELFVVHEFTSFRVVTFALRAAKTVLNLASPGHTKLADYTIVNTSGLIMHDLAV